LISENTAHAEGQSTYPKAATLVFDHVQKRYPGASEPAIQDLSFEVPAGRICVLVGPSGCGKTTAMRLVNRMIELTSGDILLDGRSVRDRDAAELRRGIGYAIQQIGLFPHRTVADNIVTVPRLLGWDKARMAARVDELLDLLSLDHDLRDRYPSQLSGGQRQRVGVARALAADPPLLLMDEPFGAVDPIARDRIQGEFLELQRRIEKTVLFVTHDIDEAIRLGDRVAMLRVGGRVAQYGSPQELLMRPADGFVADFVGADRALKRLSLMAASEMDLEPLADGRHDLLRVDPRTPVRTALSEMLEADAEEALVGEDGAAPLGRLTVDAIARRLEAERTGARAIP
jgi:osmoprotectant transport system ATP-binding protein